MCSSISFRKDCNKVTTISYQERTKVFVFTHKMISSINLQIRSSFGRSFCELFVCFHISDPLLSHLSGRSISTLKWSDQKRKERNEKREEKRSEAKRSEEERREEKG